MGHEPQHPPRHRRGPVLVDRAAQLLNTEAARVVPIAPIRAGPMGANGATLSQRAGRKGVKTQEHSVVTFS